MHGLVECISPISYSFSYLILYPDMKIVRIKPETVNLKRELDIDYDNDSPVKLIDSQKFSLETEDKKYEFTTPEAEKWVAIINEEVAKLKDKI